MPRVSQQSTVWGTDTTWKACHSHNIAAFTMPCPHAVKRTPRLTCMTPLAGGPMRVMPKLSQEGRTKPPSSTMPAGVCQIVIFSTSACTLSVSHHFHDKGRD